MRTIGLLYQAEVDQVAIVPRPDALALRLELISLYRGILRRNPGDGVDVSVDRIHG
ncbi:hypothetical protein ALQ32_101431 [Pseudomonas syringae pv. tagetis]|uniref:Uncharacterized protein n=1 Tax=Pseudomonas syringae pv. tagetis TaxID=129140 RepID=A0A3M3YRX1_9PSED|nr:Unknown protein sequence [Pseudomonas amygdali pv. lachrymans]RMO85278.1 hypothetical protein ALQ32_101431 [Pseudomonas syringae pv. tagetis]